MEMSRVWRGRAAWVLLVTLLWGLMPQGSARAQEKYDPQHTMLALNMAIVSVHRIVTAQDRIVLDQEYRNIINNLSLGNIEADFDLTELYQELMDVISHKTLRQEESERFLSRYERREKNQLVRSLTNVRAYGGGILSFLGSLAVSCTSAYFGYEDAKNELQEGLEDELWQLKKEDIDDCNTLQQKLLNSSWNLLRQYKLPDEYRLVQKNMDDFYKAVREPDANKRLRMLQALEMEFRVYPPYWFYRGRTALETGDTAAGRQCFERFDAVWRPVLRQDPYKLEVAKHRVRDLLDNHGATEEVLKQLEIVKRHTPRENWADNLFTGVAYFALGEKDRGIKCVEPNIDFGYETEVSSPVLRSMRQGKLDPSALTEELKDLIAKDDKSVDWYLKAAEQGLTEAQNNLAQLYRDGKGLPQDDEEAAAWFSRAAKQGLAEAQNSLAQLYRDGKGLPQDDEEAAAWFFKAAKQGLAEAQNSLAQLYRDGKGLPQDDEEAAAWFLKAAKQGLAEAQNSLAQLYRDGKGVPQDDKEAAAWFLKAAEQGNSSAQYALGELYMKEKEFKEAYKWYCLAKLNDNKDAQDFLDRIEGKGWLWDKAKISHEQIEQAQAEARKMYEEQKKRSTQ